jgi:hypothetical protein
LETLFNLLFSLVVAYVPVCGSQGFLDGDDRLAVRRGLVIALVQRKE